jgi:predicted membrane-bound spermidine synthase
MRSRLALIFFLSGASALVFESLWFRLAGLSLGNSVWSASLVLAAFMGGIALGNALVARHHHRISQPVRLYAGLEFTIGIGGIAVVLLLPILSRTLGPALSGLTEMPLLLNAVRLSIAFGLLVVPAIAMGATLPVLVDAMSRHDPNFGSGLGWLYGWNTLGAMSGAILAELVLVPTFGILNSGMFALTLNLLAAIIALQMAQAEESGIRTAPAEPNGSNAVDSRTRRFLLVAFLSGALMLALEVVWFRFLLLTRDGTSLIFAVMLAIVLAGIAVGGLVAGQLFQRDDKAFRWLPHVTAASAALVVLTYWGYDTLSIARNVQDVSTSAFIGYATFLMFPVAFLSGVAFTMVNRAVKDRLGASSRTAGIATFYNTIGAMLGSLVAGFVLLPVIGMELSFFLLAATYLLVALVVPSEAQAQKNVLLWGRGALVTAALSLAVFPFGLLQKSYFGADVDYLPGHSLVTTREGLTETLRYYQREVYGQPKYYRLVTNGHSMSATSTAAKRYMKLYVYLPLALNPDTRDALLISYGVASTAKALTDSDALESIDVVDISKDILDMSSIIYPGDDNPLKDDRVQVHVEDGRFFLNTTDNRYDLITSEPPPPKNAGVVNLYSQEYFELIREHLNPGGYASYWLPVQQLAPTDALAIVKAFCNAFDDCSLWSGGGLEWMLMGSNGAEGGIDVPRFSAQWRDPKVAGELVALGFENPAQMGSLFMADANLLNRVTTDVAPVVDNYPSRISSDYINYLGHIELYGWLMDERERLDRFRASKLIERIWPDALREESEGYFEYEALIKNHLTGNSYRSQADPYAWASLDRLLTDTTLVTLPLWLLGSDHDTQEIVSALLDSEGYKPEYALELARKYTAERNFEAALMYMNDHISTDGEVTLWESNLYLYLLAMNDNTEQAAPIIANLRNMEAPEIDRYLDWHDLRFSAGSAPGVDSATTASPQVAESFD